MTANVDFESHEISVDGVEHVATGPIRFRSEELLRAILSAAGLVVDDVVGGFGGEPLGRGAGTLAVTARRP
jgi:hypothetical protein